MLVMSKKYLDKEKIRYYIFMNKACVVDLAEYCRNEGCDTSMKTMYNLINGHFAVKDEVIEAICKRFNLKPKDILQ